MIKSKVALKVPSNSKRAVSRADNGGTDVKYRRQGMNRLLNG